MMLVRGIVFAFSVLLLGSSSSYADINQHIADTGSMFTYTLDTGSASASPLSPEAITAKRNWRLVPEEGVDYSFKGDVVLLNDQLVVVLRQNSRAADVYTLSEGGLNLQAQVFPHASAGLKSLGRKRFSVVENNPGAAMVRVTFLTDGQEIGLEYRLTTGQPHVQILPAEGVDTIRVKADTDYLVVPDFFGDDVVYGPETVQSTFAGLPAENFYLHLTRQGQGIITCVSEMPRQYIRGVFSGDGDTRQIIGSEINCSAGKAIWLAFSDQADTWHRASVATQETPEDVALDWTPPFSAKWRGNFVTQRDEISRSWNFREERLTDFVIPDLGNRVYPCWFQDSVPMIQLPMHDAESDVPLVVYPIDRTQSTPLNQFVLVDIMRGTLGVGPCQYILDLEGLDAQSTPTPALVSEWVEQLFKRKRAVKSAKKIEERCASMLEHVAHSELRIAQYKEQAQALKTFIDGSPLKSSEIDTEISRLLDNLYAAIDGLAPARKSQAYAEQQVRDIMALIGQDDWGNSMELIVHKLHSIGHAQDRTLAKCRMSMRLVEQRILTSQDSSESMTELNTRVRAILGSED